MEKKKLLYLSFHSYDNFSITKDKFSTMLKFNHPPSPNKSLQNIKPVSGKIFYYQGLSFKYYKPDGNFHHRANW